MQTDNIIQFPISKLWPHGAWIKQEMELAGRDFDFFVKRESLFGSAHIFQSIDRESAAVKYDILYPALCK